MDDGIAQIIFGLGAIALCMILVDRFLLSPLEGRLKKPEHETDQNEDSIDETD